MVNLEGILDDIDTLKGNIVVTKVFLKIQHILKDVGQCKSNVKLLSTSTMNVNMSFILDKRLEELQFSSFKMGSISLDTAQPHVAISVLEILFPISPANSLPVSLCSATNLPCRTYPDGPKGKQTGRTVPLSQINAQKLASYNVKLDDDEKDCWITGVVITNEPRHEKTCPGFPTW